MRLVFAVFFLLIAYVASYPAFDESATDNDESDLELELRSILNHLDEEQMTRSLTEDDDDNEDNDDEYTFSKRQGGHNVIDKQSDCEIKCIYGQRFPASGKGKTIKDAAATCKNLCPANKKRVYTNKNAQKKEKLSKKTNLQKKEETNKKLNLREFFENDDSDSSEEEQQAQRRELYNYLMEQLQ